MAINRGRGWAEFQVKMSAVSRIRRRDKKRHSAKSDKTAGSGPGVLVNREECSCHSLTSTVVGTKQSKRSRQFDGSG